MRENSNHVLAHRVAARLRVMRGSVVSDAWTVAPRDALPTKPKKLLVLLEKHVDVRTEPRVCKWPATKGEGLEPVTEAQPAT